MSYHTLNREALANSIGALGSAANLDFTNVIGDNNDLPVSSAVKDAIDEAISSVYKPKGSKAVSELTSALLVSSNKGNVYNMSTNGTTTADFVEGAGKEIKIGDNVVIVEVSQGVYKFDLLSGMVDLTNYYTRTDTDGLLNNKVDKVTGKGLSTNDYTTAEKDKLTSLNNNYFGTSTGQAALQNKAVVVSSDQHFELKVGCVVAVKFDANNTYSATTSAPVTMNVNNTGAKNIYGGNTATNTGTNTTYFGRVNAVNYYLYDGTYWVWAGSTYDNIVNFQLRFADLIKAETAITANKVVVGTSAGYKMVASGTTFDISYPVLYCNVNVNAGATNSNFWVFLNNITSTNIKASFTGTAHKMCYLVLSSISGVTATIDSTLFTITPNVEGKYYIPIGLFTQNNNRIDFASYETIYMYKDGALQLYGNNSGGGGGGGHDYDVSMNADLDEMTLSEDNVGKTTLPLVTEYIGTRANWNNLSASEQAKYRKVTFLGEGGNNDASNDIVDFNNSDVPDADANSWTSVTQLSTGLSLSTLFGRISQMFKNTRYLFKLLGTTDISTIGNGTITGALRNIIIYRDVTIGSVTTGTGGYVNIASYRPSISNYSIIFVQLWNYGQGNGALIVDTQGDYASGNKSSTWTNVVLRYFFVPSNI